MKENLYSINEKYITKWCGVRIKIINKFVLILIIGLWVKVTDQGQGQNCGNPMKSEDMLKSWQLDGLYSCKSKSTKFACTQNVLKKLTLQHWSQIKVKVRTHIECLTWTILCMKFDVSITYTSSAEVNAGRQAISQNQW